MHKVYKFRLYPTKAQLTRLECTLEICRMLYNKTLAYRRDKYNGEKIKVSNYTMHNLLPQWKRENHDLEEVFSQTLQEVQGRVDLAFKHFFRRVKNGEKTGYPRFKGKGHYDSFCYLQRGFSIENNRICLSKIGDVSMVKHREVDGEVKRVCVRRRAGKWYAMLTVEVPDIEAPLRNE